MGASSKEAICNIALRKFGQKRITDITDPDDTTSVKCNDVFDPMTRKMLGLVKPGFATLSVILGHVVDSAISITAISVSSGVITVTAASHGLASEDKAAFANVGGMIELNGKIFTVTRVDANNVTLDNTDGSAFTDYTSGGTIGEVSIVGQEKAFDFRYNLPSDYLALKKINDEDEIKIAYAIESKGDNSAKEILTDEESMDIKYIYYEDNTTLYDDWFVDVLAWLIASEVCYGISQSRTLAADMRTEYKDELAKAQGIGHRESGSPRRPRQDDVIEARQ